MENTNQDEIVGRAPVPVITNLRTVPALNTTQTNGLELVNEAAVLEAIRSNAMDPSIFDEHPPYVWAAEISSNRNDYYYTRMDVETTLRNYAEDAIAGVSFLNSHVQDESAIGYSFASILVQDSNDNLARVYGAFYTIPDLQLERLNTDSVIKQFRSGLARDVSVGFKRGENFMMRCSVCGFDMYRSWDCDHFQGVRTKVWDDEKEEFREVVPIAVVVDGRLGEVSKVYDGATPKAMIEKAIDFAKRGLIKPDFIRHIEAQYRMTLPGKQTQVPGIEKPAENAERQTNTDKEIEEMANGDNPTTNPSLTQVRSTCISLNLVEKEDEISSVPEGLRRISAEVTTLRAVKNEHDAFIASEVKDAITEGVRAYGDKFDKNLYEGTDKNGILYRLSLTELRKMRLEWQTKADEELGAGNGRRSTEDGEEAETVEQGTNAGGEDKRQAGKEKQDAEQIRAVANETQSLNDLLPEDTFR